jgi:hypothetical protein
MRYDLTDHEGAARPRRKVVSLTRVWHRKIHVPMKLATEITNVTVQACNISYAVGDAALPACRAQFFHKCDHKVRFAPKAMKCCREKTRRAKNRHQLYGDAAHWLGFYAAAASTL